MENKIFNKGCIIELNSVFNKDIKYEYIYPDKLYNTE